MKTKVCAAVVAVLIAWGLKRHYAGAGAGELWRILTPTAEVVNAVTGAAFVWQPGEGYFSRDHMFLIEKSCAGVNFMVAAFGMLAFALLHRVGSVASAARVMGASLVASYAAAVATNAVRIAIALWLGAPPAALAAFSAADIHRIEGITVYFVGLVLLYELTQRLDRRAIVARGSEAPATRRAALAVRPVTSHEITHSRELTRAS